MASPSLIRLAFIALLALAPTPSPAQTAPPAGATQGASVEGVTEYHAGNGLRVLLMPGRHASRRRPSTSPISSARGTRTTARPAWRTCSSTWCSRARRRFPTCSQELGRRGMRFNGTTFFDRTNYFETFSANDDNLDWALRMEAERMTQSTFIQGRPRHRDDGRAQRVRDGREQSAARALEAAAGARVRLAQLRQRRRSARARTSRTSTSTACARSTAPTTSRTTRC